MKKVMRLADHKRGKQSFVLPSPVIIQAWCSVAGKKEGQGPLAKEYDLIQPDSYFGQKTWEQAEKQMQLTALNTLLEKSGKAWEEIDGVFSGDLLNQCIGSSFTLRNSGVPHIGLYGACSTMAESMLTASMAVGGGFLRSAVAMTSSHFASSERQYRFPLGYGGQRTPTAQWTVTGSGAVLLGRKGSGPKILSCTIGTVKDLGIKDANNMGAAMAPAAFATIRAHLQDLGRKVTDYDRIITGDLGHIGKSLLMELAKEDGIDLTDRLEDCGTLVFDANKQDVHAGGSGCGCSAIALCGHFLNRVKDGSLKRILFCGTGALLSPTSTQQGLPIPGVCHAVEIAGE